VNKNIFTIPFAFVALAQLSKALKTHSNSILGMLLWRV